MYLVEYSSRAIWLRTGEAFLERKVWRKSCMVTRMENENCKVQYEDDTVLIMLYSRMCFLCFVSIKFNGSPG
ncbi:hypothetical protein M8J76_002059 [Diaphorina citri]|nr:hypothetical protein M8J76_002059 [Diaphorina citri]